MKALSGV